MATKEKLIVELIRAKMINAKREKESLAMFESSIKWTEWASQEIAFKQLLDILEAS